MGGQAWGLQMWDVSPEAPLLSESEVVEVMRVGLERMREEWARRLEEDIEELKRLGPERLEEILMRYRPEGDDTVYGAGEGI